MSSNSVIGHESEPRRHLSELLADFHRKAGSPSFRSISHSTGISHTTVAETLTGKRVPSWNVLQRIANNLSANETVLHDAWDAVKESRSSGNFASNYKDRLLTAFENIPTPGIARSAVSRFELLYQEPKVEIRRPEPDGQAHVSPSAALHKHKYLTITGLAGSGKTALTQHIARLYCQSQKAPTPFVVVLRDLVQQSGSSSSVLDHVDGQIRGLLQLTPPNGWLDSVLRHESSLVMFDGLDEVPAGVMRQRVTSVIRSFQSEYPRAHLVLTCRTGEYSQEIDSFPGFALCRILPMSDGQVREYFGSWLAATAHDRADFTDASVDGFAREFLSGRKRGLVATPLLLPLLCEFFVTYGSLPETEVQLYSIALGLLIRQWDETRRIELPRDITALAYPILRFLAYVMLSEGLVEIGEHEAQRRISRFLLDSGAASTAAEGDEQAGLFMQYSAERSGVLMTRTANAFERQLQFAHLFFVENLAGEYMARDASSVMDLAAAVVDWILAGRPERVAGAAIDSFVDRRKERRTELLKTIEALIENRSEADALTVRGALHRHFIYNS